jgi:general secretion pathway protein G
MKNVRRTQRSGFTLIELMVVVAIIGLLLGIAVPNFIESQKKARQKACFANQKTVAGAIVMRDLDKNLKTDKLDDQVWKELKSGGYLQDIPADPGSGKDSQGNYELTAEGNVRCKSHGSMNEPATATATART